MDVVALLIPHSQPAVVEQPTVRGLDVPAMHSQPAAMLSVPPGNDRLDAAFPQRAAHLVVVVVPTIRLGPVGASARAAVRTLDGRDGVDQRDGHVAVVAVGPGVDDGQRRPFGVGDEVAFAACFPTIRGIRTGLRPPKTARTEEESSSALDQSML
jgi:hypothetical protein